MGLGLWMEFLRILRQMKQLRTSYKHIVEKEINKNFKNMLK
jgi:hypothetical protein